MDIPGEPKLPDDYKETHLNFGTNTLAGKAKIADGFVRSKRNQSMIPDDGPEERVLTLQKEKGDLIRRLNDSLMELDVLNEEKRKIHDSLIEQTKFVRDLDAATGGGDDLNGLVSLDIKLAHKKEKALHKQLDAQLQKAELERA